MSERLFPEIEKLFENWISQRHIEVALFDLDDTLIDTNTLFGDHVEAFIEYCLQCAPHIAKDEFKTNFEQIDAASYPQLGVSPKKWPYVVTELSESYGVNAFKEGLFILEDIYKSVPNLFTDTESILQTFRNSGTRLGVVTHASQQWTDLKIDSLGIRKYFEHIKVIDVDEHKYKSSHHWAEAIKQFDIDPAYVFAAGDNLRGDIVAAHEAGVSTLAWIPSRWHIYNQGDLPEGAFKVDKIGNLIPTLIGQQ